MTNESSFQHIRDEFLIRNYNANRVVLHRSFITATEIIQLSMRFSNRKKPN